jgi:hypothetical protein
MESDELFDIPIEGLNMYRITNTGKIWSRKSEKFLKTHVVNGYECVQANGPQSIHRLVARVFLPNPNNDTVVHHKNEDKLDNQVSNLEWTSQKQNLAYCDKKMSHPRKVLQLIDGKIAKEFGTVTEAADSLSFSRSAISKACLGVNKTACGFTWKYSNEDYNHAVQVNMEDAAEVYDYPNYHVFPDGKIYNTSRKSFLKPIQNASGYCYVTLCGSGRKKKNYYVHRIVADHHLPIPADDKLQVNHINKVRNDNSVQNLEWLSSSDNMKHAHANKGLGTKS